MLVSCRRTWRSGGIFWFGGRLESNLLSTALACDGCLGPFGSGAPSVRLLDLTFHEVCAPSCRHCGSLLRPPPADDEERWNYAARVVSARQGYRLEPTEFWCQDCWELGARSESYAQD
jgi:hypothetical protein